MTTETTPKSMYDHAIQLWKTSKADRPQAVKLMEQAVAQGDAEAHVQLAYWLIQDGNGIPHDKDRAIELFTLAAEMGHPNAPLALQFHRLGMPMAQEDWDEAEQAANDAAQNANQAWDGKAHTPLLKREMPAAPDVIAGHSSPLNQTTADAADQLAAPDASSDEAPSPQDGDRELVIDNETGGATWRDRTPESDSDEDLATEAEALAEIRGVVRQPFSSWQGSEAPELVRANLSQIVEHITRIVDAEQAIMVNRLLRLYAKDLGMQRLKGPRKQVLISALRSGVRSQAFDQQLERRPQHPDHWALFSLESPGVPLRSRGGRPTNQIPLREIASAIRALQDQLGALSHDDLRDIVMREWFSLGAVGAIVRDRFERALKELALAPVGVVQSPPQKPKVVGSPGNPGTPARHRSGSLFEDAAGYRIEGWDGVAAALRAAAEAGEALAQLAAGIQLTASSHELAQFRGERLLRAAAAQGETLAAIELARYLQRVYPESREALTWTTLAADAGDLDAIGNMLSAVADPESLDYQPNRAAVYKAFLAREQLGEFKLPSAQLNALGALVASSRRLELRRRFLPSVNELAAAWNWSRGSELIAAAQLRIGSESKWIGSLNSLMDLSGVVDDAPAIVEFSERLNGAGLKLIPDPRFDAITPRLHEAVVIRPNPDVRAELNHDYATAVTLTRLAIAISAADGEVTEQELTVLRQQLASNLKLTTHQTERLSSIEQYLLEGPPDILEVVDQIADQLSPAASSGLGDFLVSVAIADGVLHEAEMALLSQLFQRLGLDPALIAGAIRENAPTSVPAERDEAPEHSEPAEPKPVPQAVDAIRARMRNRFSAVAAQLGELNLPAGSPIPSPSPSPSLGQPSAENTVSGKAIQLAGLDRRHEILVRELVAFDLWNRAEAEDVAETVGLDLADAVAVIREWSDKLFGEPVMELSDAQLEVRVDNIQELLAA